jgi:serralysin
LSRGGVNGKSGGFGTDTIGSFDVEVIQVNPNRSNVIDGSTGNTATMTVDLSKESLTINNLPFVGSASLVVKGFQDVLGSENAGTITGSNLADNLNGGGGNDLLRGLGGAYILTGGAGSDTLAFGIGDSLLSGFDRITDLAIGTDEIDGWSAVGKIRQLGRVASLGLADVSNLLDGCNFTASGAATFSLGSGSNSRTFLALNDGQAGFQGGSDGIIVITGFSGDLSKLTVV